MKKFLISLFLGLGLSFAQVPTTKAQIIEQKALTPQTKLGKSSSQL